MFSGAGARGSDAYSNFIGWGGGFPPNLVIIGGALMFISTLLAESLTRPLPSNLTFLAGGAKNFLPLKFAIKYVFVSNS